MKLKMAHIQLIGLKAQLAATVAALQELGCVQIDPIADDPTLQRQYLRPFSPTQTTIQHQAQQTDLLTRVESLVAACGANGAKPPAATQPDESETDLRHQLETVGEQVRQLTTQRDKLEAEQAALPRYETTLRKLLPLVPPSAQRPDTGSIFVFTPQTHRWSLDLIREQVQELAHNTAEIVEEGVGDLHVMLIVLPQTHLPQLENLLGAEDISRLRLPDEFAGQSPDAAVASLTQRLQAIPQQMSEIEDKIGRLASQWLPYFQTWRVALQDECDRLAILERLGETDQTFVISCNS